MTTRFVDLLSKEIDFDDSMSLKQAHYVLNRLIEEVNFDDVIEAGSLFEHTLSSQPLTSVLCISP